MSSGSDLVVATPTASDQESKIDRAAVNKRAEEDDEDDEYDKELERMDAAVFKLQELFYDYINKGKRDQVVLLIKKVKDVFFSSAARAIDRRDEAITKVMLNSGNVNLGRRFVEFSEAGRAREAFIRKIQDEIKAENDKWGLKD